VIPGQSAGKLEHDAQRSVPPVDAPMQITVSVVRTWIDRRPVPA